MHKRRPATTLSETDIEKYFLSDDIQAKLKDAFLKTYFKHHERSHLESEQGERDIAAHVTVRYTNSLKHVVPWMSRQLDLKDCTVVELGCGTGASSAAVANFCKKLYGYDILDSSIAAAKQRADIMGQTNAEFQLTEPEELLPTIRKNHAPGSIDVVLYFAVVEHMTIDERIESLKLAWELLNEGGILVVVETPNRFSYWDTHTTDLPYFHLLPVELAIKYSEHTKRAAFSKSLKESFDKSFMDAYINMHRWGLGASYHEFELALGEAYDKNLVCEGFEAEILPWFGINVEEELLRLHFEKRKLPVPLGYSRQVLNLMYQKAANVEDLVKSDAPYPDYAIIRQEDLWGRPKP